MAIPWSVIGAGLGLLGGKGGTQTEKREPWAPVQPWLKNLITQGQDLQDQYLRQPFSPAQQQALNNKISDSNMFRQQMVPRMFGVASQLTRPMSRPAIGRPGTYAQRAYTPQAPQPMNLGMSAVPLIDFAALPKVQTNADLNKLREEELKKMIQAQLEGGNHNLGGYADPWNGMGAWGSYDSSGGANYGFAEGGATAGGIGGPADGTGGGFGVPGAPAGEEDGLPY